MSVHVLTTKTCIAGRCDRLSKPSACTRLKRRPETEIGMPSQLFALRMVTHVHPFREGLLAEEHHAPTWL